MAVIAFPQPPARITSFSLMPVSPGQVLHEAIYTGQRQVYNRGPQYFEGNCTFGSVHVSNSSDSAEIRQFFNLLNGSANTFRIRLYDTGFYRRRGTFQHRLDNNDNPIPITVSSSTSAGDNLRLTLSTAARDTGIVKGDFLTINDRLYVVSTSLENSVIDVSPNTVTTLENAVVNFINPTIHCRLVGSVPATQNQSGFYPNWTFQWVEVV